MTIDTSRESVERLLARAEAAEAREQARLMTQTDLINDTVLMGMARDEAIAERDAALAEVARLSTAPGSTDTFGYLVGLNDAAALAVSPALAEVISGAASHMLKLHHALAVEHELADSLNGALQYADTFIRQELGGLRNPHRTAVLEAHVARRKAETLAKHGSKT